MNVGSVRVLVAGLFVILFAVLAFGATNPTFVSPANQSTVSGIVNFNFTFDGTVNYTLTGNGSVGQVCSGSSATSPKNCTWNSTAAGSGSYSFTLNTTNSSNASDSSNEYLQLTVDLSGPTFAQINVTPISSNNFTNKSPVISILVNEPDLNLCQYHLGGGTWINLTQVDQGSTVLCTGQVANQSRGALLNFTFRAIDDSANTITSQPLNLTADIDPPVITITNPAADYNISDGSNFTFTASIADFGQAIDAPYYSGLINGTACNVTIEGADVLSGTVVYNNVSGTCNGTLTLADPSGISDHPSELWITFKDRVNNTRTSTRTISIDNAAPQFVSAGSDQSGNVIESITELFDIVVNLLDNSYIRNATASYGSSVNLSGSTTTKQTTVSWSATVNASRLGCTTPGICVINVLATDTWGHVNTTTFNLIYDTDYPKYQNNAVNTTNVSTRGSVLASSYWIDHSLNSSSTTTARLLRSIGGASYANVLNTSLNTALRWSNFTYIPTPSTDEGENISLRITYADFSGRSNTTTARSFLVTNSSPVILNLTVLNRVSNTSNETPTFSVHYADEGKGFANSGVVLNVTGPTNQSFTKGGSWICDAQNTYNTTFKNDGSWVNFSTSSYGATSYSFLISDIGNANSTTATNVQLTRYGYGRSSTITLAAWGDYYDYEDIRVTLVSSNDLVTNQTKLGFVDLGYTEQICNYTASGFTEGTYNVTLQLTDQAGNTNSSVFSWVVDGARPSIVNLTVNGMYAFLNSAFVNTSVTFTNTSRNTSIAWYVNDSTLNTTNITPWYQSTTGWSDSSGASANSTSFLLYPGNHLFEFNAYDILGPPYATQRFIHVYANTQSNISEIQQRILADSDNEATYNFDIIRNSVNVSGVESGYLNGTVSFNFTATASTTPVNISIEGVDGMRYNWWNTFFFRNGTNSIDITNDVGVNTTLYLYVEDFYDAESATKNGSYHYTQFLPTNNVMPNVNWTFNASGNPYIVLLTRPDTSASKYLLEECSGDYNPADYSEACYNKTSDIYTVFAPAFTGIALGQDAGAPNISVTFPSTPVNDSQFSLFLEVIEPSPNATLFCNYAVRHNGTAIDSDALQVADFTLNQSRYTKTFSYTTFNDSDSYSVNVTCFDANGYSTVFGQAFEVDDSTPPEFLEIGRTQEYALRTDFTATLTEYARIRLNLSTDPDPTAQTDWSEYGTNVTLRVTDLSENTLYYYSYQACDLNEQCTYYPLPYTFYNTNQTDTPQSGGGGGGGGGGGLKEGSIVATHHHAWSTLEPGWLRYGIGEDDIAVTGINVLIEELVYDPFIQVMAYLGKPANVPRIHPIAYQYFRIEHNGLNGAEHELEFAVSEEWLRNHSATPENVHLYRYEQGNWSEHAITIRPGGDGKARFRASLPGFSFFVIQVDGVEPEPVENVTFDPIIEFIDPIEIFPPPEVIIPEEIIPEVPETNGTEVGYEQKESGGIWLWVVIIILMLVAVSGGAWYVLSKKPVEQKGSKLDPSDPFYKLQQFIVHALEKGHTPEEVRAKLISVGWDEIIVDEELEAIMTGRV